MIQRDPQWSYNHIIKSKGKTVVRASGCDIIFGMRYCPTEDKRCGQNQPQPSTTKQQLRVIWSSLKWQINELQTTHNATIFAKSKCILFLVELHWCCWQPLFSKLETLTRSLIQIRPLHPCIISSPWAWPLLQSSSWVWASLIQSPTQSPTLSLRSFQRMSC